MYKNKYLIIFIIIVLCSGLLNFIVRSQVITENILIEYFQDHMSYKKVVDLLNSNKEWGWLNYVFIPLFYIVKFGIISFWLLCGTILFDYKIKFNSIFKTVLLAEFVWLLPTVILIIWFWLIESSYTFNDVQYFAPLSLLSIFDASQLDSWLIFPLKSLNLFEVIYLLVLALGIKKIMKKDYDSALKFTLPVYGSALVVWILFVTFLSINLGA